MSESELRRLIEQHTEALRANPQQAETLVRRGILYHQCGDLPAALADFTAALAIQPNFPEALNNRAVVRHAQGEYSAALADLDEALRLRSAYPEAYNNRGNSRHARGDFAGAMADYDLALRLQPDYAEAYNNRGAVRQDLQDLAGALADFDMALRLEPNYAEALDNRAYVHYLLWHHAQAVADCDRALALYRQRGHVDNTVLCRLHICRGDASYHDGNAAGLLTNYRQAFQHDPELAARLVVTRLARDIEANFRLVLANCDKHLRENPDDYIAYARRGLVWLLTGDEAQGQRDIDLFYQKHPNNPLGLVRRLADAARRYCQDHGVVVPGNTVSPRPPGTS